METATGIDYSAVLADLKKRREDLDKAIALIEQIGGFPSPGNGVASTESTVVPINSGAATTRDSSIREDTFFGMNIASAAQKYLEMRKKPATPMEIANALSEGGLPTQSDKLHNTVNSVLNRNANGPSPIFAKVKRGTWGLRAWYPNYRPLKDSPKDEE